jgi:hypothetical protein
MTQNASVELELASVPIRLRWHDYVLGRGNEAVDLVSAAAAVTSATTLVVGLGFDPRMLTGLRELVDVLRGRLTVIAVGLAGTGVGEVATDMATANRAELATLVAGIGASFVPMELPPASDRRRAGLRLAQQLTAGDAGDHVVVDISALPKDVYFPLVASWLARSDEERIARQVQVLVTENPRLDDAITGEGTVAPAHLGGFQHGLNFEAGESGPWIWAPVLGPAAGPQLEAIHDRLRPVEICPVLPFPARNPRRGDDLVLEHGQLLVSTFAVESGNYIYANEANPFDLYRALSRLHLRYRFALAPLGNATVVISTHASKALSIGALLGAYEHKLPVVSAGPSAHGIDHGVSVDDLTDDNVLTCLWLYGEPYSR